MKHVFILNPKAGKPKTSTNLLHNIKQSFHTQDYEIHFTTKPGHATEIAASYAKASQTIYMYACGGDGTINEVVNGIANLAHIFLIVLPIGTGNDFIRSLPAKKNDFFQFDLYKDPILQTVDLIQCEHRYCINVASIGFDATVVEKAIHYKQLPIIGNTLAYNFAVFHSFLTSIDYDFTLVIDKTKHVPKSSYLFVVMGNAKYYGGGFYPFPSGNHQDGVMDILTIDSLPRKRIVTLLSKYKKGEHIHYDFTKTYQCQSIQILATKPLILNFDGEVFEVNNPELHIVKGAIQLLLPNRVSS